MVTIDTSEFREGLCIKVEDEIYSILWYQHHKPGKGGAVMRTKLRNIRTGSIIERTFKSGERFEVVDLVKKKKQYMYQAGDNYVFMDMETFEEIQIPKKQLGEAAKFLKENVEVEGLYLNEEFLGIELPTSVELKVIHTVPGIRGDSVSNVMKPATLETGVEILVPLFVEVGDIVKVDTRTGEYIERVESKK
ncbi:MAG: elongation factor P [Elusimicrobiota bacterium]|nr:elongation factor P [Endomicrobiia bacterium]MCX7910882.1 elongation factor P [Endomicrobiia bacterium]MDW8164968.1 elongation factor P [Elusimicrobiota bacterium]